jgi:hypothetical protein
VALARAGDIKKLWPALSREKALSRFNAGSKDAAIGVAGRSPRIPPAPARPRSPSPAPATPPPRLLPGRGVDPGDEVLEPRHRGARSADRGLVASWHSYSCHPCATQPGWTSQVTPVIAKVPVMAGEMGESDCGGNRGGAATRCSRVSSVMCALLPGKGGRSVRL